MSWFVLPPGKIAWMDALIRRVDNLGLWFGRIGTGQRGSWAWIFGVVNLATAVAWVTVGVCLRALYYAAGASGHLAGVLAAGSSGRSGPGGALLSVLEWCNNFVPIEEGFILAVALLELRIGLTAYRTVKSWIPTLSG